MKCCLAILSLLSFSQQIIFVILEVKLYNKTGTKLLKKRMFKTGTNELNNALFIEECQCARPYFIAFYFNNCVIVLQFISGPALNCQEF